MLRFCYVFETILRLFTLENYPLLGVVDNFLNSLKYCKFAHCILAKSCKTSMTKNQWFFNFIIILRNFIIR